MKYGIEGGQDRVEVSQPCSQSCWACYYGRPCENVYAQQAREQTQPRAYVRTVHGLILDLIQACESVQNQVVTPLSDGSYEFEIADHGIHAVLRLREVPCEEGRKDWANGRDMNQLRNDWDARVLAQALSGIPAKETN
jgi:hypothetical protein